MPNTIQQSIRSFILKSEKLFNESFQLESGGELFADRRFSADKLSNRIVTITALPAEYEGAEVQPGYEAMIDPTPLYQQNYNKLGDVDNPYMIDRHEGLFKCDPKMVVLYRENGHSDWKGFGNNLLVGIDKTVEEEKKGALIIKINEPKERVFVKYGNAALAEEGVNDGDEIFISRGTEVSFWIDGKEYFWIETKDVLAKIG